MAAMTLNLWIFAGVTFACWLASVLTKEYSWVDRIWSIVPAVYAWVFAAHADDARVTLAAVLISLWGLRLTFNFARRGGYAPGGEDYRWAILRAYLPGWRFGVFNALFIAMYQNALLLAITLPLWTASADPRPLGAADAVAAVLFLAFLLGETVADQQRWDFHKAHPAGGVMTTGLYAFSRHPNYFFEISQWWVIFAFGAIAAGTAVIPTIGGAVLLTLLFLGSTAFTEWITARKHPEFASYKATTSMLIPWPPRPHDTSSEPLSVER